MPLERVQKISDSAKFALWRIEESVEELFEMTILQKEELDQMNSFKVEMRKKQWLTTRKILEELAPGQLIRYNENGKPQIDDGYISISHSGEYVALIHDEKGETGIDIQLQVDKIQLIRHKFLHSSENDRIGDQELEELTLIWCAKEAIYKCKGKTGIIFKEHIEISPRTQEEKVLEAKVSIDAKTALHRLNYEIFDDYCLVYVAD